ncbi:hypothetical protein J8273_0590 [Carpediemonas membranifera]|uniref:Uncharacterized protein n=1 Tax=Carpediemonas membranifera TaxID=201153 RepID=A0A8J6E310_9EUKA|nr:hypothetical protein J8273_0590 [Carpediemonas membranifera]|eukprot:KAG9395348.1 hypothetical protein J8273_0590 [Carpediemonas membranifera]
MSEYVKLPQLKNNMIAPIPQSAELMDMSLPTHPLGPKLPYDQLYSTVPSMSAIRARRLREIAGVSTDIVNADTEALALEDEDTRALLLASAAAGLLDAADAEAVARLDDPVARHSHDNVPRLPSLLVPHGDLSSANARRLSIDPRTARKIDDAIFSRRRRHLKPSSQGASTAPAVGSRLGTMSGSDSATMSEDEDDVGPIPQRIDRVPVLAPRRESRMSISDMAHTSALMSSRFRARRVEGPSFAAPRRPPSSVSIARHLRVLGGGTAQPQDVSSLKENTVPFVTREMKDGQHNPVPKGLGAWYLPVSFWGEGRRRMKSAAKEMEDAVMQLSLAE